MLAAGGRAWLCALALLLPVLCTDAAPRPPNYRGPRLFSESAFFSHKKTQLLPVFPPLDLAVPGQLDVALEARAYKRQLILFMFDATAGCKSSCSGKEKSMLGNTVAMIAQLNDIGFAHYIAVTPTPTGCAELHSVWQHHHGARPSCAVAHAPALAQEDPHSLERVGWTTRYWLVTKMVEKYIDVLLHDVDIIYHSDPYVHFKSPPLNGVQLVVLPDDGVMSSGLVYIHNAQPNGAANWVLRQVERRSAAVASYERSHGGPFGAWLNDEGVLRDAMRVAQRGGSASDWGANFRAWREWKGDRPVLAVGLQPFWVLHPQPPPLNDNPDEDATEGFAWSETRQPFSHPNLTAACPLSSPPVCARWDAWLLPSGLADAPLRVSAISVPSDAAGPGHDAPVGEKAAAAPAWVFAGGQLALVGWSYAHGGAAGGAAAPAAPRSAMTHLGGSKTGWADTLVAPFLVGRALTSGANGFLSPVYSLGAERRHRLLWLHEDAVAAAAMAPTVAPLKAALRSLGLLAAAAGLLPVMPIVPCNAPWITRLADGAPPPPWGDRPSATLSGIDDHRIIVGGSAGEPICSVAEMGVDSCWPWDSVVYAWDDAAWARRAKPATTTLASVPRRGDGVVDMAEWAKLTGARDAPPPSGGGDKEDVRGDVVLLSLGDVPPAAAPGGSGPAGLRLPPAGELSAAQRVALDGLARACPALVCPPDDCAGEPARACAWASGACEAA